MTHDDRTTTNSILGRQAQNEQDRQAQDDAFLKAVRDRLESSLPPPVSVQARLREARQEAVSRMDEGRGFSRYFGSRTAGLSIWKPVASFGSVLAVALVATYFTVLDQGPQQRSIAQSEVDVLFAEEDLEFYQNLEFYSWLAADESYQ